MHDNGPKSPIPFPGASAVPLVGQAYQLRSVIPTALLVCQCESKEPVLLVGLGAMGPCPACARVYKLMSFTGDVETGNVAAGIGVGGMARQGAGV